MKGLFTTRTAAVRATLIDSNKIESKKIILDGQNLKDSLDNLEQIITELEIKRPKISNVSFKFGEIKNGSIENLSFVDGEIVANVDTKFHLIQLTIDGEKISSPILKTENGWVVRIYEADTTEEDILFLYPTLSDDSEFSLMFVSSGDDIDGEEGGTSGGGLCNCEPFELTAEAIQQVVPIAWSEYTTAPRIAPENSTGNIVIGDGAVADDGTTKFNNSVTIGANAKGGHLGVTMGADSTGNICSTVVGNYADAREREATVVGYASHAKQYGVAVGTMAYATSTATTSLGTFARTTGADSTGAIAVGFTTYAYNPNAIVIGSSFSETVDGSTVTHTCTTEGTGSITIGAGANTLNSTKTVDGVETTVESSNSITIGCKAENKGADSVVIGAQASSSQPNNVIIGAGAGVLYEPYSNVVAIGAGVKGANHSFTSGYGTQSDSYAIVIGYQAKALQTHGVALGTYTEAANESVSVGRAAKAKVKNTVALGAAAEANDAGVVVLSSRDAGDTIKTQLYFSGTNTPLANEYYNGEAFMGYTVTDTQTKQVLACGTRRLSELFPDNSLTQPATLDEFGEWVQPKVFHPSDLDMPIEEDTLEPEEYQPLPVYPIVEPEIEEYIQE